MLVAQISDTHLAPPGEKTFGHVPMAENLGLVVWHINTLTPRPDAVLVSGDITNNGTRAEALRAKEILDLLECPYYVLPGNHDARAVLAEVFDLPTIEGGFIQYTVEGLALRLVALDSVKAGAPGGAFCETRAEWLAGQLDAAPHHPTLVCLHHPPLKCGVPESDQDGFEGAARLGAIIARHKQVERILCGHIHLHTHMRWQGTTVTTAPSIGMQLDLDLTQTRESRFVLAPPAYLLHHWHGGDAADAVLVSHYIRAERPEGPFPFAHRDGGAGEQTAGEHNV